MLDRLIIKLAHSRFGLPAKALVRKLRETYYNAEVLRRPLSKTAPLPVSISESEPARVNLLIPEINFARFYGGYIAKFHLARKLVERGYRVRIVTVDQCVKDLAGWRAAIGEYAGLENIFDQIEVECCFDRSAKLKVSPQDVVIATTWWTAYIAEALCRELGRREFIYLVQEFEPFTFPMGSYYALAEGSYDLPHKAMYSTELLQDYFRLNQVGYIFKDSKDGTRDFDYFENAIISYPDRPAIEKSKDGKKRLLFYSRPEAHAARNMFEIGYLALVRAIEDGVFGDGEWEFHGIGSSHGDIPLPNGNTLKMLGKFGLEEYKARLLGYDLGLALMYTPHPSLLPLEMAAAGMIVITNSCMNKTAESMSALSPNLRAANPTIQGVVDEMNLAVREVDDHNARLHGARVNWATDWEQALDGRRMDEIGGWIDEIREGR